ncbi:hypothetical protein WH47_02254 [Habropoda laboriosa]|uniref:Uncharacterized protein n=1 Tax=Habropoda laboriosa TaxID=597456 RepID=A0A0L7QZW1_9HYME|nr:hypothetical protein WH47_02254 [Habropoda laboriosa]
MSVVFTVRGACVGKGLVCAGLAQWISLSYGHAASGDNDKGGGPEVRKYNYGVAYRRPRDQAVITRTAELNTCGVVNSPFSRATIDRSINLRAPVAIRQPVYTKPPICGADHQCPIPNELRITSRYLYSL